MIRVELGDRFERLVEERESRLAELDAAIAKGIASADAGLLYDADEVFDELEARYTAMIDDEK